jgi:hypothetical protein
MPAFVIDALLLRRCDEATTQRRVQALDRIILSRITVSA